MEIKESTKKSKYDQLECFLKNMILNTTATSLKFSASEPAEELLSIINYSTLARSQTMLNFYLHKSKCVFYAKISKKKLPTVTNSLLTPMLSIKF